MEYELRELRKLIKRTCRNNICYATREMAFSQLAAIEAKLKLISPENRIPDKVKPLAQYLAEYIDHEATAEEIDSLWNREINVWHELLEQALDAYESTEGVKIKIEKI